MGSAVSESSRDSDAWPCASNPAVLGENSESFPGNLFDLYVVTVPLWQEHIDERDDEWPHSDWASLQE